MGMGLSRVCARFGAPPTSKRRRRWQDRGKREKNRKKKPENNFLNFFSFLRLRRRRRLFSLSFQKEGEERSLSTLFLSGTSDEGESRWVTKKPNRKWRPSPSSEPSRPPPPSWDLDVSFYAS